MKSMMAAMMALLMGGAVLAQAGSRPPAVPVNASREIPMEQTVAQEQTTVSQGGPQVPGLDSPQRTIVRETGSTRRDRSADVPTPAELQGAGFAGPVPTAVRPRIAARRPASEIEVDVGVNRTFGIAKGHINRIVTPFREAKVVTTLSQGIEAVGGIVYVTTNADESIGVFIHESDDPENAIALTLVPGDIEQVSTRVRVRGLREVERARPAIPASRDVAQTFETASPYVETLAALMSDLAHGRMPEGYGLEQADVTRTDLPACRIPGARAVPAQVITGSELFVVVYQLTALSAMTVDESKCSGAARAVAAWPRRTLRSGEQTELYAVFTVPSVEEVESIRPSVIGGGR